MALDRSEPADLIKLSRDPPGSPIAVITINRPKSLNSLTRPMMVTLAGIIRQLNSDPTVSVLILTGAGDRAFCSGVDLTAAESVFKGDVKDPVSDPVKQLEACKKPVIGAINGYAVTAGFEIALACDILVAGKDAKFIDTHAKFGIFPSWGLSQKLSRIIGPMRARQVSLSAMPVSAEMAEKWGLVNHVVEKNSEAVNKAKEIAEAIIKNNRDLVFKYKAVINDGFNLDLCSALALEKERAHSFYDGMTKDQFAMMQKFIQENEIIRSISIDIPQSVPEDVTPDELRQKAVEEKKMHRLLKSQGKPDQALQAFKRGRDLERQADALEILLRKNRKTAAGKVKNADRVDKKQDSKRDDLASELRDLGWADTDLQAGANPKTLTVEGELSRILGEVAKKPSPEGKKKGVDNSQVIAMKKRALLLKREGKLTEAKEELKKAKVLERELEERAILGESDDSDDELAELVRGLDGHGKTNDLDLNDPIELPPMGFDIEKLLSGDVEHFGDFEVTNEDLYDPDLNSALKSFGWDEEEEVGNVGGAHSSGSPVKEHLSEESVKDQVYTLKKEAVVQKKSGNLSEAMALLKKAKLLEKNLLEVGSKESSLEIKEKTSQRNTGTNLNPSGGRPGLRNKLAIQRELLAVKKQALALRREGKIEESDRELERGKLLEKELEEADNRSKLPVNMNPVMENTNPLEIGDEIVEAEVTESDMQDPGLLSVLQNLGWDEKEDSGTAAPDNFVKQPPKRNKFEIQRELLAVKKRALALRREGKIEESQRELESAKYLERELDDLNSTASESKGTPQPVMPISFQNPMKLVEEPAAETQVTDTDVQNPALMSDLRNLGWDEDDGAADVAPSLLLQEKAPQKEIENFPNQPATVIQSGFGDMESGTEAKPTETDKRDPRVNEGAVAEPYNSVPERKVKKSKGEMQRELLALKRTALQLRRQGREEEAESELEKAKELEKQLAELESHSVPASEQLLMPQPSASSAIRVTEKPVQVTQLEAPLHGTHLVPDQNNSLKDEILMHKRKALALKREGKISEAKEELKQAKLLEKTLEEESTPTTHLTATVESEVVVPESKPVQTRKSISTRDRVKIQQESLSHKRNALKLRREGKVAEAEAEFEIAKSLEAQLDDSTGEDVSSSSDVAVEDFLDPQLMSVLRSIGWGESDFGTVKQEPSKRVVVERETSVAVESNDERLKMEGEIKREKIKALNLKRAGREKEALEVLRNAKLMEKKLASIK